jgi:glycosyltransferase involved in cell wall biosynthesis
MISFIVIGRNEERNIKRCIDSIIKTILFNNLKSYEIIYVDSNSNDESISIVKAFKIAKIFSITGQYNAAIGRNIGARESQGNILFFIDADMEINKDFLKEVIDHNNELKYNIVTGQVIDVIPGIEEKPRYTNKREFSEQGYRVRLGGIFLIRRNVWESVNGMRTKYNTGEEADLMYRLIKNKVTYIRKSETICWHYTINIFDKLYLRKLILNKSVFYTRSVTYRDHFLNYKMYFELWDYDKTFILLLSLILFVIVNPHTYLIGLIVYFTAIILRSYKQTKSTSYFRIVIFFLLFDILNIIYLFTFFPKNKKIEYVPIV